MRTAPVYELLAEDLVRFGVKTGFLLMSDDTLGLCASMDAAGIELCSPRHETNVVLAAEGYAAATGSLGLAVIGRGPAAANGMHGIMVAARSGSPVLIIMGDGELASPLNAVGPDYKAYNAQAVMEAAGLKSFTATTAASARETLALAISTALRGAAVVLHIPVGVQNSTIEVDTDKPAPELTRPQAGGAIRPQSIKAAASLLDASQRPVIVAGIGAHRAGARTELEELAKRTGALLVTSFKGKDLFRGSPYNLGICGSFSHSVARKYIEQADCILVFGASLNFYTTSKGKAFPDVPVIHNDVSRHNIGRWFPADVAIVGDAKAAAAEIARALPDRTGREQPFHDPAVLRKIAQFDLASDFVPANTNRTLDPRVLAMALEKVLPKERNLIYDAGNFIMAATYLSVAGPGHLKVSSDFASMGAGFGTAIGFATARPDEANVLIIGDGGFVMAMSELETVARMGTRLIVVVYNDGAYGCELQFCREKKLPEATSVFADIDFAPIAEALGFRTATIRSLADLDKAAGEFGDWSDPILLDCKVNVDVQAPFISELVQHT
jgi:thiamine pyrophosphate-dependent acetolactate synthase large subunit-like protein